MNNTEMTFFDALISGDASGAIERSEKREQQNVVMNQRMPIKSNDYSVPIEIRRLNINDSMQWEERFEIEKSNNIKWTREQYEKMGIKIVDEYDDLFFNVILPDGWKVKPTDHSMWNEVVDEKGRKRISFFYKGAFYDREAFSNFEKRFTYSEMPFDDYQTNASYEERNTKEWYGVIYDAGKEIYRTFGHIKNDYFDNIPKELSLDYLNENYPDWNDINSYWD